MEHRLGQSQSPPGQKWLTAGILAALTGAMAVLFLFDPAQHAFFPRCPLHELTGWSCPGCGTLRAIHQLCHGNFAAAWRFNALTVSLMPVALWLGVREAVWYNYGIRWPGLVTRSWVGWALVGVAVLFGIMRNLPWFQP